MLVNTSPALLPLLVAMATPDNATVTSLVVDLLTYTVLVVS